jgi:hypothetical protein
MEDAAIGIRVHSGWGALVSVSMNGDALELVESAKIVLAHPSMRGGTQPYHLAATLESSEAQRYLDDYAAASERETLEALRAVVDRIHGRGHRTVGCGLLMASGRPLPAVPVILGSHALIHTAEGELFRNGIRAACERLGIRIRGYRQRDLGAHAHSVFGGDAMERIQRGITNLGRAWGSPWTSDQKTAALAACVVLAEADQECVD